MTGDLKTIRWGGDDPFTHTLILGPTRCGKTAIILKRIIWQILEARARGIKAGLSIIEPKGDVVEAVKEICDEIGEPLTYINPNDPANSDTINVMAGDKSAVAEATVAVLKSLFGKQEAFFEIVQELSARKITLLLKELYQDNMYITDVLANLRDEAVMKQNVERLRLKRSDPDLVDFFDNELLHGKDAEEYRKLIKGLRAQLENITSNEYLKPIITKKSSFNLDHHFSNGGILACNTALGRLGRAVSDAFGQFIAMHLQLATFRRPGTERTRIPHYLIIDEYSRYINPDIETFLSIAAEYRVAGIFATQSLGQLEVEAGKLSPKATKTAILTSCRNKIIFGGLSAQDAKEISAELGKDTVIERSQSFDGNPLKSLTAKMYKDDEKEKDRFPYTVLMDGLPRLHFVHKLLQDGHPMPPGVATGDFITKDPQVMREHFRKIKEEMINPTKVTEVIKGNPFDLKARLNFKIEEKKREIDEKKKEHFKKAFDVDPFSELSTTQKEQPIEKPTFQRRAEIKQITFHGRKNQDTNHEETKNIREIKVTQNEFKPNSNTEKAAQPVGKSEQQIKTDQNSKAHSNSKEQTKKNIENNKQKSMNNPADFWSGF